MGRTEAVAVAEVVALADQVDLGSHRMNQVEMVLEGGGDLRVVAERGPFQRLESFPRYGEGDRFPAVLGEEADRVGVAVVGAVPMDELQSHAGSSDESCKLHSVRRNNGCNRNGFPEESRLQIGRASGRERGCTDG